MFDRLKTQKYEFSGNDTAKRTQLSRNVIASAHERVSRTMPYELVLASENFPAKLTSRSIYKLLWLLGLLFTLQAVRRNLERFFRYDSMITHREYDQGL